MYVGLLADVAFEISEEDVHPTEDPVEATDLGANRAGDEA